MCLFSISGVRGYFEHRYFCTVDGNTITVSIYTGEQGCFPYMEQLSTKIDVLDSDLAQVDIHIDKGDDISYRSEVQEDLKQKKTRYTTLRSKFVIAIDDYEYELFLKVKSLAAYYMMPRREDLLHKIDQADTLLLRLKLMGDEETYAFVIEQLALMKQELLLLDQIRFARSFLELIPPLKIYIRGGGIQYTPGGQTTPIT